MSKVIVVGGGAAGMFCALNAASYGHEVTIYEKNEKLGKKLFITGKGRCNVTNAADMETIMSHVVSNPKFLYSSFSQLSNRGFMDLLESYGLRLKVERGERVFPESDHSSDVIKTLSTQLHNLGVTICYNTPVKGLIINQQNRSCEGVFIMQGGKAWPEYADYVVLATGGLSYPSTGSTGDGLKFAKEAGHTIEPCVPSLVPMNVKEVGICKELMGLSLKNVTLMIKQGKKVLHEGFGEMLFTHFGISGPLVLTASCYLSKYEKEPLEISIDLKPAMTEEMLEARLGRELEAASNKAIKNVIGSMYPSKMVPIMLRIAGIDPDKKANSITKEERMELITRTKAFPLTMNGFRDYNEAIITHGGVSVREINPQTMESKLVPHLYFCGEIIDVDAETGGYNLQIAWSSAYAAGTHFEYL